MNDFKTVAISAAKAAGDQIQELAKEEITFKMKGPQDIQVEADLVAEKIIKDKIRENFSSHSILSEEAGEDVKEKEFLWIVDPLDGTINFARHIEEYCVSIALCHNDEIILGVIYQPTLDKLFWAEKGKGAYLNDRKISVATTSKLIDTMGAMDITSQLGARERNMNIFSKLLPLVRHMRIFGSSALHMARLAQGQIDIYFKMHYNYWDYAAGIIIVQEAGGIVTDAEGQPVSRDSETIVAGTAVIHPILLEIIKKTK